MDTGTWSVRGMYQIAVFPVFADGGSLLWVKNKQGSPQTQQWECFLVFGNFSLFKTPFPGWSSIPTSFVSLFFFYIFSYLLSKTMVCFSGRLMSSASNQKLFCGIHSAFKCSFDEFVGEKVVSTSYSSTILGPPLGMTYWLNKINNEKNQDFLDL